MEEESRFIAEVRLFASASSLSLLHKRIHEPLGLVNQETNSHLRLVFGDDLGGVARFFAT